MVDGRGNTPLHLSAANGHSATSQKLIDLGANVNAKNKFGDTPLALAKKNNHGGTAGVIERGGGTE